MAQGTGGGRGEKTGDRGGEAVQADIDRLLPILTEGMDPDEAGEARETLAGLSALRAARPGGLAGFREELEARGKKAGGLSLGGRRGMIQEDALALGVGQLCDEVGRSALGVLNGEVKVTPRLKRETRRALARLGQLHAVLVGRFPHLTRLMEEVSEAYLDAMFILGDGTGPRSTRLQKAGREQEPAGKGA